MLFILKFKISLIYLAPKTKVNYSNHVSCRSVTTSQSHDMLVSGNPRSFIKNCIKTGSAILPYLFYLTQEACKRYFLKNISSITPKHCKIKSALSHCPCLSDRLFIIFFQDGLFSKQLLKFPPKLKIWPAKFGLISPALNGWHAAQIDR